MIHSFGVLSLLCYVVALILFTIDIFRGSSRRTKIAESVFAFGFIAHTVLLVLTVFSVGAILPEGKGDFYLFLSWAISLSYGFSRKKMHFPIVGAFFTAASIMLLASSSYLLHLTDAKEMSTGIWFRVLHIFPAFVAELCLVVAVVLSVIFSIQSRRLKRKQAISAAMSAPSLDLLSAWTLRLVTWGFVAMSFSVVSGSIWALLHNRSVFSRDPFQWMGFLVWVLFVAIHVIRYRIGESGRTLSQLTMVAGIVLVASLIIFLVSGGGGDHAVFYLS